MPYIVTTTQDADENNLPPDEAPIRRAVATLDEAREYASQQVVQASYRADDFADAKWGFFEQAAFDIGTAIGAIGPLPDGTVIEVEQITYGEMAVALGTDKRGRYTFAVRSNATIVAAYNEQIIDAYNAAQ